MSLSDKLEYQVEDDFGVLTGIDSCPDIKSYLDSIIRKYSYADFDSSSYELTKLLLEKKKNIAGRIKAKEFAIDSKFKNWSNYTHIDFPWDGKSKKTIELVLMDINSRFYYDLISTNSVFEVIGELFNEIQLNKPKYDNSGFDAINSLVRSRPAVSRILQNKTAEQAKKAAENIIEYLYILPEKKSIVITEILKQQKNRTVGKGFDEAKLFSDIEKYTDKEAMKKAFAEIYLLKETPCTEIVLEGIWESLKKNNFSPAIVNYRDICRIYSSSLSCSTEEQQKKWFVSNTKKLLDIIHYDSQKKLQIDAKIRQKTFENHIEELKKRISRCSIQTSDQERLRHFYQDIHNYAVAFMDENYFLVSGEKNPRLIRPWTGNDVDEIKSLKQMLDDSLKNIPASCMTKANRFYEQASKIFEQYIQNYDNLPRLESIYPEKHNNHENSDYGVDYLYPAQRTQLTGFQKTALWTAGIAGVVSLSLLIGSVFSKRPLNPREFYENYINSSKKQVEKVVGIDHNR